MVKVERYRSNPLIRPNRDHPWEALAASNGSITKDNGKFHMVYRAISYKQNYHERNLNLSAIGHTISDDGINFGDGRLFIKSEFGWEIFGCEDPRITRINGKYFIFYTALSNYPPTDSSIKIGLAITKDFVNVEKHPVTFFNSKAMALFPEKINGKLVAILTVNTDIPPAKICLAFFDEESQIWSEDYWKSWFFSSEEHVVLLPDTKNDQIEVGAPPVKTKHGWLIVYANIKDYLSPPRTFGIEAVLLDLKNPFKVIGRTKKTLLVPEMEYELYGVVPHVIFPSGAIVQNGDLFIYYGAADTTCCLAICNLDKLIEEMLI
ncbi:MAG TPA: hypothetical protein C5S37_04570 [Methanophagales archaeon]|nr:hypothetical protein [Methanophagales archaeon]